jgi:predicted TIM-barrel fold metal-dependent hydrolase
VRLDGVPPITPDRWLGELERASFTDDARPLFLKQNAAPPPGSAE